MFEYYAFYFVMLLVAILFILMDFYLDMETEIFFVDERPSWHVYLFGFVFGALHLAAYAFIIYELTSSIIRFFRYLIG